MKKKYRLPNGEWTDSIDEVIEQYKEFGEPIEELTGLKACGFDPGISFTEVEIIHSDFARLTERLGKSISLPNWFIQLINEGLERMKK